MQGIWAKYVRAISWEKSVIAPRLRTAKFLFDTHAVLHVRDGSSSLWDSNLLGSGPLRPHLLASPPEFSIREAVDADFLSDTSLQLFLPPHFRQALLSRQFHFIDQPDCVVWQPSSSGIFSVSTAYSVVRSQQSPQVLVAGFWGPNIPLKTSVFLWRLYNGFVAYPETLAPLGFSMVSRCPHCPSSDTIQHSFCDCYLAVDLWSFACQRFHLLITPDQGLWARFETCLASSEPLLRLLPVIILWLLWKRRNAMLYQQPFSSRPILAEFLELLQQFVLMKPLRVHSLSLWSVCSSFHVRVVRMRRTLKPVLWRWPLTWKLNVDGSSKGNPGSSGGGCVVRTAASEVVVAASFFFGIQDSISAELLALSRGLQLCQDRSLFGFAVETDSQLIVTWLEGPSTTWPWQHFALLFSIRHTLNQLGATLSHVYREANSVADGLARLASSTCTTQFFTMQSLPRFIRGLVILDYQQIPYVRSVLAL